MFVLSRRLAFLTLYCFFDGIRRVIFLLEMLPIERNLKLKFIIDSIGGYGNSSRSCSQNRISYLSNSFLEFDITLSI